MFRNLQVYIWSTKDYVTESYSTLKCVFCVGMSVFVFVCVTPLSDSLPNSI